MIGAALLSGFESAVVGASWLNKVDALQLRGLRTNLGLWSTYGQMKGQQKENTISKAYEMAKDFNGAAPVMKFSIAYRQARSRHSARAVKKALDHLVYFTTFDK